MHRATIMLDCSVIVEHPGDGRIWRKSPHSVLFLEVFYNLELGTEEWIGVQVMLRASVEEACGWADFGCWRANGDSTGISCACRD